MAPFKNASGVLQKACWKGSWNLRSLWLLFWSPFFPSSLWLAFSPFFNIFSGPVPGRLGRPPLSFCFFVSILVALFALLFGTRLAPIWLLPGSYLLIPGPPLPPLWLPMGTLTQPFESCSSILGGPFAFLVSRGI